MRRRNRQATKAETDLTPMLDVVFILLIFFIVTAVFLQEQAIGLEPPPTSDGQVETFAPAIIIAIDNEGLVRVNGRVSLLSSVRANVERLRAETPDSAVIIQAHPHARNGQIINIRDQVASARVEQVNLVLSDI